MESAAAIRPELSVVVCCYNSTKRLEPTLKHLAAQQTRPDCHWEIVLVDNNSTDDTREAAPRIWQSFGSKIPFRLVSEPKPGLAFARKKGIDEAQAELILFCDDDNWLEDNYIQTACDLMKSDPKIAMLGGVGQAVSDTDLPEWFDSMRLAYAVGPQAEQDGDITFTKGFVYGAGSIIRKPVLLEIYRKGFVNLLTDRIGKTLVSGGDNEIGYVMALSGWKIHYSSQLKFHHFLPSSRLTLPYLLRLGKGQQLTVYKILAYESRLFKVPFAFPSHRFFKGYATFKLMLRLLFDYLRGRISYFRFALRMNALFYRQYFLWRHYDDFKKEIARVEENINLLA